MRYSDYIKLHVDGIPMLEFSHMKYVFSIGLIVISMRGFAADTALCSQKMQPQEARETLRALRGISAESVRVNYESGSLVQAQTKVLARSQDYAPYDQNGIQRWLNRPLLRSEGGRENRFPKNYSMTYCAGHGCPLKIPFSFTERHFQEIWNEMQDAKVRHRCHSNSSKCEILSLQYAVRKMDQIVLQEKLRSIRDVSKFGPRQSDSEKWWENQMRGNQYSRDCVDQAANGTNFLVILAQRGLISRTRILPPGSIGVAGLATHWFTRVQGESGEIYRFDLYKSDRTNFTKLPGVVRI